MNFKDKLVKNLTKIGKKHRILVYPMLALIAVVTAISQAVVWSRSNGKKFVASMLVLTMLITQSLFLTSSADYTEPENLGPNIEETQEGDLGEGQQVEQQSGEDVQQASQEPTDGQQPTDEQLAGEDLSQNQDEDGIAPLDLDMDLMELLDPPEPEVPTEPTIIVHAITVPATSTTATYTGTVHNDADGNPDGVTIPTIDRDTLQTALGFDTTHYGYSGDKTKFYVSNGDSYTAIEDTDVLSLETDNTYDLYVHIGRKQYDIQYVDGDTLVDTDKVSVSTAADTLYPQWNAIAPATAPADYGKRGYFYNGVGEPGNTYSPGASIAIQTADGNDVVTLPLLWAPVKGITLTYNLFSGDQATLVGALDSDAQEIISDITYEDSVTPPTVVAKDVCTNPGYYLDHWVVQGKSTSIPADEATQVTLETGLAKEYGAVTDNPNVEGVILEGVWEYRNINLYLNDKEAGSTATITATYGDKINYDLTAKYLKGKDKNDGPFEFDNMDEATKMLSEYGLSVSNKDGVFHIEGTLNQKITEGDTKTFSVKDTNRPEGSQVVSGFGITLIVKPCPVQIGTVSHSTSGDALEKPYDATADIPVKTSAAAIPVTESEGATNAIAADGITVEFDGTATILKTGNVEGKDVGTSKDIMLKKLHLASSVSDDKLDNYVLTGVADDGTLVVPGAAEVKARTVHVTMALADGEDASVKFGQDSPKCELTVQDKDINGIAPLEQESYKADPQAFIKTTLGMNEQKDWDTDRDIYSLAGNKYYVKATFGASKNNNYDVIVDNKIEFNVTRDDTKSFYKIKEEEENKVVNGYYPSFTIVPQAPYTAVRILEVGESDIAYKTPRATAEKQFTSGNKSITKNGTNMTITFQLLSEGEGHHEISSVYTVTGINIDSAFPVYKSHEVQPTGFYVNQLGFGSYYHSQDVASAMTIKVTYTAAESPCTKLHYYFTGEKASEAPTTVSTALNPTVNGKDYEFTITVGTGGQLVVYVEDEAGKTSGKTKLNATSSVDLDADHYEWMTENIASTASMTVTGNGENASSYQWYSNLSATVTAQDGESGINSINWIVTTPSGVVNYPDDTPANIENVTAYGKVIKGSFNNTITGKTSSVGGPSPNYVPGQNYYIGAEIVDNAGNTYTVPAQGPFWYDGNAPKVEIDDGSDTDSEYRSDVVITIKAEDGEGESGLAKVVLYKDSVSDDNICETWGATDECVYHVQDSGKYIAVATDIAGNSSQDTVSYSYISSERPKQPTISVDKGSGELGNSGWYIKDRPMVTITSTTMTAEDGVPVTTHYKLSVNNVDGKQEKTGSFDTASTTFQLPYDGEVKIETWAESKSGIKSDKATGSVKSDVNAPKVEITDSIVDENGIVNISFKITDFISGVNTDKVLVNGSAIDSTEEDGVVTGSFKADGSAVYELVAHDIAGNISEAVSFEPLGLAVSPITDITSSTAHINAQVIRGTNAISPKNCYIEYKKRSDDYYDSALVNKDEVDTGLEMDYEFTRLTPDTVYDYRVRAASVGGDEERVVTGSFRTSTGNSNASIYGKVSYSSNLQDGFRDYPIYVQLYKGDVQIAGATINGPEDDDYLFKGVSDGTYRIVATNGFLTKESMVTIEDNGIAYPKNYAATDGINFELSGMSTAVVVQDSEDGTVEIAVDGLDDIYEGAYRGNVTNEDLDLIKAGGSVDITLYARYVRAEDIATESGLLIEALGKKAEIVRYIILDIEKRVYNPDGSLRYTDDITQLADPLTISFPLEELSGQEIYVASWHANDKAPIDWRGTENISISEHYVTITTDRFSVYALYRLLEKESYTVTWKDGDGKTLKTELVEEGSAATPPEGTPTKKPENGYGFTFVGWDQDYSHVTKDMVILATFEAYKQGEKPNNNPINPNGGTTGGITPNGGNITPNANVVPGNGSAGNTNQTSGKPTYSYIGGGAGSPQTGDATPIVLIIGLMVVCGTAIVVLMKKRKED